MRYIICFLMSLFFLTCKEKVSPLANATANSEQTNQVGKIVNVTNSEAKKMLVSQPDIVILDVRTPEETKQGVIPNALIIDIYDPAFNKKLDSLDKSKTYLVYCAAGGRSVSACERMKQKGFMNLYNLSGGFRSWNP